MPAKVCMPVSHCRPSCSEAGEAVPENGFCCSGLSQVLNNNDGEYYCYNSIEAFEEIPGEITMEINKDDCQIVMNEYDEDGDLVYEGSCNLRNKKTLEECSSAGGIWEAGCIPSHKRNVYHFERYFCQSGFGRMLIVLGRVIILEQCRAQKIGEILRKYKENVDTVLFNELIRIETQRAQEEAKVAEGGHTVSGSFTVRLLSSLSTAQAVKARINRDAMMNILGFSADEINNLVQNNPLEIPNWLKNHIEDEDNWDTLARYRSLALKPEDNNGNTSVGKYNGFVKKRFH